MSTDPTADRQVDLSEQPGPVEGVSTPSQEESTTHRSLERGLRILGIVVGAQRPISGAEIAGIIGLHRSTVFQLTKMLVRAGLLKQWEISHAFEPGPKMHEYLGLMLGVQMVTETGKLRYPSGEMLRDSLLARQERLYQECKRIAQQHGMRVDRVAGPHPGPMGASLAIVFKGQDRPAPLHLRALKDPEGPTIIPVINEAAEITDAQWRSLRPEGVTPPQWFGSLRDMGIKEMVRVDIETEVSSGNAPLPWAKIENFASKAWAEVKARDAEQQPREEAEGVPNQEQAAGLSGPDEKGGGLRT